MLNEMLAAIAILMIIFVLAIHRILWAARTLGWKPQTCSKSCDAITRYEIDEDRKRWAQAVIKRAFGV